MSAPKLGLEHAMEFKGGVTEWGVDSNGVPGGRIVSATIGVLGDSFTQIADDHDRKDLAGWQRGTRIGTQAFVGGWVLPFGSALVGSAGANAGVDWLTDNVAPVHWLLGDWM